MERAGDSRNALGFLWQLARGGDGEAMLKLGQLYERGTVGGELKPDKERAMYWYDEARRRVQLPPRIEKSLNAWLAQRARKPAEEAMREAQARDDRERQLMLGRTKQSSERDLQACMIYRLRWDETCWGNDGSYRYKFSDECAIVADKLYNACWPGL
jgi:hypothetical protein